MIFEISYNKISWYLKRLSCMSFSEMLYRIYRFIILNINIFFHNDVKLQSILSKGQGINKKFYFEPHRFREIRQEFSRLFPDKEKKIIDSADLLCSHAFKIFCMDWNTGKTIDWHRDVTTGRSWPLRYCMYIDFRNDTHYPEARFIWELNRHQHLVTLGKAYFLRRDERYAKEIVEELLSWIGQNPAYKGINWTSPLEIGLRLISWCWAYKFIQDSRFLTQEVKEVFLKSVYLQARFIKDNLSLYSSSNNHLVGESCALIMTGLTFPEFKDSISWAEKGKEVLFKEINNQVYQDGVTKEQTFHYQGFVMELFILAAILLRKNKMFFPEHGLERFLKMSEFVMNIMDTKGNIPNIGDSDNGMAIRLSEEEGFNIFKSLLCIASLVSERGDFKERSSGFKEEHYWLFGIEGLERYINIKPEKKNPKSMLYKDGGYAILRNGSNNSREKVLIMDCGQIGYLSIAAHGHADLFSITLSSCGTQLLIDPGTYLYHTGGEWRHYFRGVKAHNTIGINNNGPADSKGLFMWGKRPYPNIDRWESSNSRDYISASYTNSSISHRRSVCFDKESEIWMLEDIVNVNKKSLINQYFHAAPGSYVQILDGNVIQILNNGIFLYIIVDPAFSIDIRQGQESPISGWCSSMFGEKKPSPAIINSAFINGPTIFNTLLYVSQQVDKTDNDCFVNLLSKNKEAAV